VDKTYQDQANQNASRLRLFTSSRELYLDQGQAPAIGATVRNPQLASTYELIAQDGPGAFYRGQIGNAVVHAVQRRSHPTRTQATQFGRA
jgi:gamma-glutamyltranspeptidase / glutathione hydrolase